MNGTITIPRRLTTPAALLGTSIGAFAAIKSLDQIPPWAVRLIETQAVGMLGFLVLLGCIIYFAPRLIGAIGEQAGALAQQAVAMQHVGDQLQVMTGQAGKLDEIMAKIEDVKFDTGIFAERLTRIEERLINGKRQDDL